MSPIEIFALILVVIAGIKILVMLVKAESWMGVVKAVYGNRVVSSIISLIVGAILLYYLIVVENLTIVHIFGVMLFMAPLLVLSFCMSNKETMAFASKVLKGNVIKRYWLPLIIWVALIVWAIIELI